jgi:hypothetical protein
VDDAVAVGPAGDGVDDSGRGDPFGVERVTVVPLPLHHNGVEVPEHAESYVGGSTKEGPSQILNLIPDGCFRFM